MLTLSENHSISDNGKVKTYWSASFHYAYGGDNHYSVKVPYSETPQEALLKLHDQIYNSNPPVGALARFVFEKDSLDI